MPKCLKESGRALRERLISRDQLTDLQIVVSHCVVIVTEDQLTAASATLFNALSFPYLADETLDSLCALIGVAFEYAASGAASGAYLRLQRHSGTGGPPAGGAGSRQWCPTCSNAGTHHIGGADRPCFLDPCEPVNVPASVWTNQARVAAMTKGREANARDLGITAGKLIPPSADAIKRYEEYAKDGKGGGKGGGRRGGGRGGGGRGGGAHAGAHVNETTREWLDGLADLTDLTMATIDDTLLMNIKHAVDDAAALEAAVDPADTTEDETAVSDEAWLSGIHEINGDGPVGGYSPYKPTVLDSPYKPTVLDSPHKLFKQSSLRNWLQATKPLEAHAFSSSGDGAPVEEEADIFFEEEAALGRARRSAEHGLPAASTTPQQALQAELATTSPAPRPLPPGPQDTWNLLFWQNFLAWGRPFLWAGQALAGTNTRRLLPRTTMESPPAHYPGGQRRRQKSLRRRRRRPTGSRPRPRRRAGSTRRSSSPRRRRRERGAACRHLCGTSRSRPSRGWSSGLAPRPRRCNRIPPPTMSRAASA